MHRFDGKRVLITGGTSGIGLATARLFLAEGARVVITGRTQQSADAAAAGLAGDVLPVGADARDLEAQRSLAATVAEHLGGLDVVFLNAGISDWRPFDAHDEDSYDRVFDTNVKSVFFLGQALLPSLGAGASVILNSSASVHSGTAGANAYAASKAALSSLMRSWNADLFPDRRIRFNAVSPGPIATPLYDKLPIPAEYRDGVMEDIRRGIPAGRLGDPAEVAAAVAYLASDDAAFVIGHDLLIDGGATVLA